MTNLLKLVVSGRQSLMKVIASLKLKEKAFRVSVKRAVAFPFNNSKRVCTYGDELNMAK